MSYIKILLNSSSISDFFNNIYIVKQIVKQDKEVLTELDENKQEIEDKKSQIENKKVEQEELKLLLEIDNESLNNDKINDLRDKTLVNLTGMTNTDLKLKYGILNFKKLSEYDDNFTKFVSMLPDYYNRLKEAGYESLGNELLDFAGEQGADSKNVYSLLANAYISMSKTDRLAALIEKAKQLNSLSRDGIVSMLESLQADTASAGN